MATIFCPVSAMAATKAVRAEEFLNSLGVCTHMAQGIDDPSKSAVCLSYLGVKNLRDDGSPAHVPDWISVYQKSGVRTCLLTNHNIAETISMAKQLKAAGALLAVEGPNEPNNWPVTYEGKTSGYETTALPIARFQSDLYKAVQAEPSLKGVPIFHTSEAGGSEKDNVGLQYLTVPSGASALTPDGTQLADYANTHNYVCGHSSKLVDNICWNATNPTLNGDWDGLYVEYGRTWHGGFSGYTNDQLITLPKVCTETGWQTRGANSVTEEQQGRVFLNLYLDGFKQNWKYTFIYMLRDDPNQGYWGLFDTDYHAKKSGIYLHNMTTILADTAPMKSKKVLSLKSLAYSIPNPPATVHDLLLQKSDGTLELIVWGERVTGSDDITVNLGGEYAGVKVYDPTVGTDPTQTLGRVRSVKLALADHPVIIEIPR
ncbi:MAG: hypothetical protein JWQ02_3285 [Capsulimonas sp.]|nr:hypothetical protein [Capsulimonas sp.]